MPNLNGMEVDEYLFDSVQIEPLALQEEYVRIAPDLAYWNARYADALKAFQRAKLAADTAEARMYIHHRERLLNGGAKVTEAQVDAAVRTDPDLIAARETLIDTESEKARVGGVCDAVRTKRDMLISLGAHVRVEMQGDPSIRTEHANARRARENG